MKVFKILCAFILMIAYTSCGSESCDPSDWLGQYSKQSEECLDSTIAFVEMIIITSGSEEGSININGTDVELNEVACSITLGTDTVIFDGTQIVISSGECTAVYE